MLRLRLDYVWPAAQTTVSSVPDGVWLKTPEGATPTASCLRGAVAERVQPAMDPMRGLLPLPRAILLLGLIRPQGDGGGVTS